MKLFKGKSIEIGIIPSGKGEPFHWKPIEVPHLKSMADMQWDNSSSAHNFYKTTHYFIPHLIQIFWLWFIIYVKIKPEKLSEGKYVKYEDTHYAMIDEQI